MFEVLDFLAKLTQHISPKRLQLIRRYGLYAFRTKGRWDEMSWVVQRSPYGWKTSHSTVSGADDTGYEPLSESEEEVDIDARKRTWVRLLAKVYEVDPIVCPKCGAEMKCRDRSSDFVLRYDPDVIAIIEDADELKRILRHLSKIGGPHGDLIPIATTISFLRRTPRKSCVRIPRGSHAETALSSPIDAQAPSSTLLPEGEKPAKRDRYRISREFATDRPFCGRSPR